MVCKKCIAFYIIFVCAGLLYAQDTMKQMLTWDHIPYAQEYEIVIENENTAGIWSVQSTHKTSRNELEISLRAGNYRYRIMVTNILNRVEPATEWYNFTVLKALQPAIESIFPDTMYLKEDNAGLLQIQGSEISSASRIVLENSDGKSLLGEVVSTEGSVVQVQFNVQDLESGTYTCIITNPGGLQDSLESLKIKNGKRSNLNISLGYSFGFNFSEGNLNSYLDTIYLPVVANFKLSFYPIHGELGSFGLLFSAYATRFEQETPTYTSVGHIFPATASIAYSRPIIENKLDFSAHLGAGIVYLYNLRLVGVMQNEEPSISDVSFGGTSGLALKYQIGKSLFTEFSLDYLLTLYSLESYEHTFFPTLSIGYSFANRAQAATRKDSTESKNISNQTGLESDNLSYLNLSAGYSFAFFPPLGNTLFSTFDFPAKNISGRAKVGYFPFVSPHLGALGFELSAYVLSVDFTTETKSVQGILVPTTFNLAYHKPLSTNIVLDLHLGAGATFLANFTDNNASTAMTNAAAIAGLAGGAAQYFITNNFYLELGVDYILTYSLENYMFHTIVPTLSAGYKFD